MSLTTVPKTNFATDDGVTTDDLNEIGQNLLDLEDSKIEDGDSLTALTVATLGVTTGNITTGNITTGNVTTLNMSGVINPTVTPTATSQAITPSSVWTPTRGIYLISTGGTIEIFVSASWRTVSVSGGLIMTGGSDVRVRDHVGSGLTIYYLKF